MLDDNLELQIELKENKGGKSTKKDGKEETDSEI
jgi:hypothetical protein